MNRYCIEYLYYYEYDDSSITYFIYTLIYLYKKIAIIYCIHR